MEASKHRYLIALGSNRRVPQIGAPRAVLDAAVAEPVSYTHLTLPTILRV